MRHETLRWLGILAACALPATACSGGAGENDDVDAAAGDAPDAGPQVGGYPVGPYGTGPDDTIADLQWVGFVDGADADDDPFNEEPRLFSLHEVFAANDPGAKVIMINSAAGWCGPCQQEAASLTELARDFHPKGVRFVTAIFETDTGAPATREFVRRWGGELFDLTIPTMIDSTFELGPYFDENAMPTNMYVDARTMKIYFISTGIGGNDPYHDFGVVLDALLDL